MDGQKSIESEFGNPGSEPLHDSQADTLRVQMATAQRRLDTGKNVLQAERDALTELIAKAKAKLGEK